MSDVFIELQRSKYLQWVVLASLLSAMGMTDCAVASTQAKPPPPTCEDGTIDQYRADIAVPARSFLAHLKTIASRDDRKAFAALLHYPLYVYEGRHRRRIGGPGQFSREYPKIVTPVLKKVIESQKPECLWGNYQGAMIGNGEIWFDQYPDGQMRIITINSSF